MPLEGEWVRAARRTNTTGSDRIKWLGSGLYLCGVCGQPALRVSQTGGKYQPAYRCKATDNTRHLRSPHASDR